MSAALHKEGFTQITKYEMRELAKAHGGEGLKGLEAKALKSVKALKEINRHETLNTDANDSVSKWRSPRSWH